MFQLLQCTRDLRTEKPKETCTKTLINSVKNKPRSFDCLIYKSGVYRVSSIPLLTPSYKQCHQLVHRIPFNNGAFVPPVVILLAGVVIPPSPVASYKSSALGGI